MWNGALVLHPVKDPRRFGIVRFGDDDRILGMIEKPTVKEAEPHKRGGHRLNIAGLMTVSSKVFKYVKKAKPGRGEGYG
jgi:dTDP-glucose pyrophosphorylase